MSKHNRERKLKRRVEKQKVEKSKRVPLTVVDMARTHFRHIYAEGELPNRQCGECSACCEAMSVETLHKPHDCKCEHQKQGGGCGIYDKRPHDCRIWYCLWRLGWGEEVDRPDRSGVLLSLNMKQDHQFTLEVHEMRKLAILQRFPAPGGLGVNYDALFELLPDNGEWSISFVPHGTPITYVDDEQDVPEIYKQYAPIKDGKNWLVVIGSLHIHMGVMDLDGNLHLPYGRVVDKDKASELMEKTKRTFSMIHKKITEYRTNNRI